VRTNHINLSIDKDYTQKAMGIKELISEIIFKELIIYYLLAITCCDIKLISCDIHKMRQIDDANNFKINHTELEQHIMNGLNIKRKPDVNLVSAHNCLQLLIDTRAAKLNLFF
jgi:hypothetical protein